MPFETIAIDDRRWSELVRQVGADIFYEPSYSRFITEGTPHRPLMFMYEDDLGKVFDVTIEKAVSSLPFFADIADQFSRPPVDLASADYNSPMVLADPRDYDELLRRYRHSVDRYCLESEVVTEFVRFHPFSESAGASAPVLELQTGADLLYVDLRGGYENAFHGYRKGHKSTIKKAAREGAGFRFCASGDVDALARVHQLYAETMRRKEAKSVYMHGFEHFQSLVRHLGDRIVIMESLAANQIASANIFLLGQKHIWFKYSGLDQRYRATGAHTFMLDQAIRWACERGFDHFMLGGGIEPGDSTYASKRGFSHLSTRVHHARKVHNEKLMNLLIEAKRAHDSRLGLPTRTAYFPSYWLN
jgi:serine/alanine adding enzyme